MRIFIYSSRICYICQLCAQVLSDALATQSKWSKTQSSPSIAVNNKNAFPEERWSKMSFSELSEKGTASRQRMHQNMTPEVKSHSCFRDVIKEDLGEF